MSAVVLRCQNCGTTQAAPGECEACHEAPVAYFCTNHAPGRWLEGPSCGQCGARFGEASSPPPRRSPVTAPPPPPAPRSARPAASPWGRAEAPPPPRPIARPPASRDPWGVEGDMTARRLRDLLLRGPVRDRFPAPARPEMPAPPAPFNPMGGFAGRLVKLALFFIIGMFLLSLLTGAPILQILLSILFSQ